MASLLTWVVSAGQRARFSRPLLRGEYRDAVEAAYGRFDYLRDSLKWQTFEMSLSRPTYALTFLKRTLLAEPTYSDLHPEWHNSYPIQGASSSGVCGWQGCHLLQVEPDDATGTAVTFSALQPFSHGRSSANALGALLAQVQEVETAYHQSRKEGLVEADEAVSAWLTSLASHLSSVMRPSFAQARTFSSSVAEADLASHQVLEASKSQLVELLVIHSV